ASASSPIRRAVSAAKRAERIRQAVATTPLSAFAAPGSCGEASGSSQSPNWKPVSHRPLWDRARSTDSRWSTMPGYSAQTVEIAVGVPQGFGDPDGSVAPDGGGDLLRLPVRERIGTAGAELEDVRHDEGNE